ncbi:MAG TPA: efflux RND transporter periplasmic adaptor subunit [Chitinophagales bacterium]|nr:efflux RND transporter periplasmic adaptor subunit [Chitinophagales bacterium]HMU98870.1 efflux RND transporter periplasmic adaptor subunit [Chitinophagales bacterium]HMV02328.1 efflux RND transporter periplasmic adaptor subunit [Chitinophagales bacterium]HMW94286.1 efflux RND transporter periplasmic adaptor subunit [Chitinophagales bacterium]HMY42472.1 efflux RND transporter periplasmic adaptor subunit [Chitinophagales bacterium]
MKTKIFLIIAGLLIVGGAAYKLAKNKKIIDDNAKPIDRSGVPIAVTAFEAAYFPVSSDFALPGVLDQNNTGNVNAINPGKIVSLNIEVGQQVTKGQIIGKVDSKLKEIALQQAELTIKKLETDAVRTKDLIEGNAAPATSILDLDYNIENTKIQKDNIKAQIANDNIYAPISGMIIQKNSNAGEFINPGTPIATIMDISILKAVVYVSENNVYELKIGQQAQVLSSIYPDKIVTGTIKYIAPRGDENHNYKVEVHIPNSGYKAGTYVSVKFAFKKPAEALLIPKIALVEGVKNPYVYVVSGNNVIVKKIEVGEEVGENIVVRNGLVAGDKVVTSGQINLSEKSKIQIVKSNQ